MRQTEVEEVECVHVRGEAEHECQCGVKLIRQMSEESVRMSSLQGVKTPIMLCLDARHCRRSKCVAGDI